jgi:hypothetical protein
MPDKPSTAAGYSGDQVELVRATCLYVATRLGDLMDDLVIVGGFVPSLIIDQSNLAEGLDPHVGTLDLDIGLSLAIYDEQHYKALSERLKRASFEPDKNERGNRTSQRWRIEGHGSNVTVDFLIPPTLDSDRGGRVRHLEEDFGALIAPGLHLAFKDQIEVPLTGLTILGESADRRIKVCGPGAFVVLKALAFKYRGENKDAYDLYYVIRNYGTGPGDVAERFLSLYPDVTCDEALEVMRKDFVKPNAVGPRRVAAFLRGKGESDEDLQVEVAGFAQSFLDRCEAHQS